MDLDLFLHDLHFHSERVIPPDWEVDWEDAPLSYKIYRDLPEIPLADDIPLTLSEQNFGHMPERKQLSYFLWYVYGLTQYSETVTSSDGKPGETYTSFRRFAPSGGGLYPNELYLYLQTDELPNGIYHYDNAHHRLLLLREGTFNDYIEKALGTRVEHSSSFATIILTARFWKNFFKYHNFAYRLQGLDAGALIGQLYEISKPFRYEPTVHFHFLDDALNHLLGLNSDEESTYAVLPLRGGRAPTLPSDLSASSLSQTIPAIKAVACERSKNVLDFSDLVEINEAAMLQSTDDFRSLNRKPSIEAEKKWLLPQTKKLDYDLAKACRNRYSPDMDFVLKKVDSATVSSLLKEASQDSAPRLSIYGCFYQVEGLPDGAYKYDAPSHAFVKVKEGDFRLPLQQGMTLDNVNLHEVPLCLHIAGDRDHYKDDLGYRGYRIQHMEAGMLLQRLLLTASALGMNGHPLLGFDVQTCDQIYGLESRGETTLIQIPIGYYRPKSWLKGGLLG
ncbi:SagB family peptide dehydrogenase [Halobacillus salinarum]|uniref:SagB family peptide dehydrogenase n=1 Tax=Halobacillus salinarum TaxID=2932257 RepID=A0ABY4EM44_9BACI|nr:SagB family peptide dehydrogenase [Halobacillus salinarum]UOQ45516.1 SagB family peptide dehydrogenase [Halobacillus salinarum]